MVTQDLNSQRWTRFRVSPCWTGYQDLAYVNEPFNDSASLSKWRQMGYTQQRFTGDMYDMRNSEPRWMENLRWHLPWRHFSWSIYRMGPGCVLPEHSDTYAKFREIYNIPDQTQVHRAVIFLEDWQPGHYFDIHGRAIVDWQAGDGVIWQNDVAHTAANVGSTNRYTLQITGVPDDDTLVQ